MNLLNKQFNGLIKINLQMECLNLSIQHTSASLIVQENADPNVQTDLISFFDKLVPMNKQTLRTYH